MYAFDSIVSSEVSPSMLHKRHRGFYYLCRIISNDKNNTAALTVSFYPVFCAQFMTNHFMRNTICRECAYISCCAFTGDVHFFQEACFNFVETTEQFVYQNRSLQRSSDARKGTVKSRLKLGRNVVKPISPVPTINTRKEIIESWKYLWEFHAFSTSAAKKRRAKARCTYT